MTLGDFLKDAATRRREPGVWDCATMPAAWTMTHGTADPMAKWRGTYDDEESARRVMAEAGGLVPMFTEGLALVGGWVPLDKPEVGAVGVLRLLGHEAGGVYVGDRKWALVATRGLAFGPFFGDQVRAVWGKHG